MPMTGSRILPEVTIKIPMPAGCATPKRSPEAILRDATIITEWDGSRWVNYDWLVEAFGLKPKSDAA